MFFPNSNQVSFLNNQFSIEKLKNFYMFSINEIFFSWESIFKLEHVSSVLSFT